MGFGFWGCVGWEEEKAAESSFSGVFFLSLVYNLCGCFILLDGVFSYMLVD
jgi:hypothetical protein